MKKAMNVVIWLAPLIILFGVCLIHVSFNSLSEESNLLYFVLYYGYHVPLIAPMYAVLAIIMGITKKIRK
jgi:hypothetical protein